VSEKCRFQNCEDCLIKKVLEFEEFWRKKHWNYNKCTHPNKSNPRYCEWHTRGKALKKLIKLEIKDE